MVALLVIHTFSLVKKNKSCYTKLREEKSKTHKVISVKLCAPQRTSVV
jgi:hypothetical protein